MPSTCPTGQFDSARRSLRRSENGGRLESYAPNHAVIVYGSGNVLLHITSAVLTLFVCVLFLFPWIVWANTIREHRVTLQVGPSGAACVRIAQTFTRKSSLTSCPPTQQLQRRGPDQRHRNRLRHPARRHPAAQYRPGHRRDPRRAAIPCPPARARAGRPTRTQGPPSRYALSCQKTTRNRPPHDVRVGGFVRLSGLLSACPS